MRKWFVIPSDNHNYEGLNVPNEESATHANEK